MFTVCRIVAWVLYTIHLYEHGAWGSDYIAIALYANFNPKKAQELADKMFPIQEEAHGN